MTACALIDIPCHLQSVLFGWIAFVPWWAWALLGLIVVGIIWKIAGWPGIIALAAGAGFLLGRRQATHEDDIWPDPDKPVRRSSQKPPPGKVTRTIFNGGLGKLFGKK